MEISDKDIVSGNTFLLKVLMLENLEKYKYIHFFFDAED
jgi:hypothetical protein